MKRKLFTTMMALVAIVTGAWAQTDNSGYLSISSSSDWAKFAKAVQTNPSVKARLTRDVNLGSTQTMIGSIDKPFQGIFDGQGHTLTVNMKISQGASIGLFRSIKNATIKNLHVAGSIETDYCGVGGIAGSVARGSTQNTISRCCVSATLSSGNTGGAQNTIGGFIGTISGNVTFEDCLFNGRFNNRNTRYNGGFCGNCTGGTVIVRNCLNMGSYDPSGGGNYSFIRNASPNLTNSYFLNSLGTAQGAQVTTAQLSNGTVASKLQGNRTSSIWVQDKKTNRPQLKIFALSGSTVTGTTPTTTTPPTATSPTTTTTNTNDWSRFPYKLSKTDAAGSLANLAGNKINEYYYIKVTGRATGRVYFQNPCYYSIASQLATAAVHSGALKAGETRVIMVQVTDDTTAAVPSFNDVTTRNGVTPIVQVDRIKCYVIIASLNPDGTTWRRSQHYPRR